MKFAKELDRELVPEWRAKYLNYKLGKKKLKAVARALKSVQNTPRTPGRRKGFKYQSPYDAAPQYSFINRTKTRGQDSVKDGRSADILRQTSGQSAGTSTQEDGERQPLTGSSGNRPKVARYGSIIASPPPSRGEGMAEGRDTRPAPLLELPEPALDSDDVGGVAGKHSRFHLPHERKHHVHHAHLPHHPAHTPKLAGDNGNAFEVGKTRSPPKHNKLSLRHRSIFQPKRVNSSPAISTPRPSVRRLLSAGGAIRPSTPGDVDVPLEQYREVDYRQAEFFTFLDKELEKIESFYKEKENEATERMKVLREQLHIMRDRRLDELMNIRADKMKRRQKEAPQPAQDPLIENASDDDDSDTPKNTKKDLLDGQAEIERNTHRVHWHHPFDTTIDQLYNGRIGKTTKAMESMGTPPGPRPNYDNRDYSRRPTIPEIPYRTAKRKLKVALQEYYRGLELLKSYALLNRKAFRKINKKYDKTVNARPAMRYVNEKVNHAWFVQSEVLDNYIHLVEDLYARYFERGNHKVAAGKLRAKTLRAGDFTACVFRNGLLMAGGAVFGVEGLVYGSELLFHNDPALAITTNYLLQLYGGYFLSLLLFLMFCLVCRVWSRAKINYVFVFEYDTRTHLDWRQLAELPCLLWFLLGLTLWLNFTRVGGNIMYIYWPVVLIGLSFIIIFFPARTLYHKSRSWLLYSSWRLLLSGLYPVEFRDFFLGDMFCSLTYMMGNIEVFFCLYAHHWSQPAICNSTNSRLLGFLTCLPGIWRALQCIRRYYDTRNVFPHLVNCGKYTWTILYYMSLSLYRMHRTDGLRALFIVCACINAIYCSIWDLVMDWSLIDPYAEKRFLRNVLAYKRTWIYYAAMVIDPILRFNWIFYAIFAHELQHAAVLSFAVSLSEVFRRAMWTVFRVENEHCTNVGRFRASRDIPLPYTVESESSAEQSPEMHIPADAQTPQTSATAQTTGADLEAQNSRVSHASSTARRRHGQTPTTPQMQRGVLNRMGTILHSAHAQDFERKRKVSKDEKNDEDDGLLEAEGSDDDDDEQDDAGSEDDGDEEREERMVREEGLLSGEVTEAEEEGSGGSGSGKNSGESSNGKGKDVKV